MADREPELRPPIRRFLVGLGLIGALALTFWFVESRTGWNGLDPSTRAEATARFSEEASRVAGKPVRSVVTRLATTWVPSSTQTA